MKRKILACLMAAMMVIGLLPANAVVYETGKEGSDARGRFDSQNVMIRTNHDTVLATAAETPEGGENTLTVVPADKLIFENGVIKGIDKDWLAENQDKLLSVTIPEKIGDTTVTSIGIQAFNNNKGLASVDLSNTKVTTIGKFAFGSCISLKDVILPSTLTELGSSVFTDCKFVESIRLADSPEGVVFALPEGLTSIGYQCFKNCFAADVNAKVVIPASVTNINGEAFEDIHITQIIFEKIVDPWKNEDYRGYENSAMTPPSGCDRIIVLPNNKCFAAYSTQVVYNSNLQKICTYPIKITFSPLGIQEQHLNHALLGWAYNSTTKRWDFNNSYKLPDTNGATTGNDRPGYEYVGGWKLRSSNQVLNENEKLEAKDNPSDFATVSGEYKLANPTISYLVDGKAEDVNADQPFTVTIGDGKEHTLGVQVSHPLLLSEQGNKEGEYVYFEYCWWDEGYFADNGTTMTVNGPRSTEEPNLFSKAGTDRELHRVWVTDNTIPITKIDHARTDHNYYLVEIRGYVVKDDGDPVRFYQSSNNFIHFGSGENVATVKNYYTLQVKVDEVRVITATAGDNGTISPSGEVAVPKGEDKTFTITPNDGYHIQDVKVDDKSVGAVKEYTFKEVTEPHTIHATFARNSSGGPSSYTLSYVTNGGKAIPSESKSSSWVKAYKDLPAPTQVGYLFDGWYYDASLTKAVTGDVKVNSRQVTLYAGWTASLVPPLLNGDDHFAYVQGYPDGMVHPNTPVTRAQVATILFRLLQDEGREKYLTETNTFQDVTPEHWANTAVSTMAKMGVFRGRSASQFDPNAPITRGEFAAVCARLDTREVQLPEGFRDLDGHWAKQEVLRAAALGWVQGYEDGTYRPNADITRAQAITMINRVLCRMPEKTSDLLAGMSTWKDCVESDWFYLAVQEATNSHNFEKKQNSIYESWTALKQNPDWSRYER